MQFKKKKVRELVLDWSVSRDIKPALETRHCENCGNANMHAACLVCTKCQYKSAPCAVTGQPVLKKTRIDCTQCGVQANRDAWMVFLFMLE